MLRALSVAALLAPAPGAATQDVRFAYDVQRGTPERPEPAVCSHVRAGLGSLYGDLDAGLDRGPGFQPRLDFTLGLHPAIGRTEVDLRAVSRLRAEETLSLALARPFGPLELGAMVRLTPETETALSEARAALRLGDDLSFEGTLGRRTDLAEDDVDLRYSLTAARAIGDRGSVQLRFRDGELDPACVEFTLELDLPPKIGPQ